MLSVYKGRHGQIELYVVIATTRTVASVVGEVFLIEMHRQHFQRPDYKRLKADDLRVRESEIESLLLLDATGPFDLTGNRPLKLTKSDDAQEELYCLRAIGLPGRIVSEMIKATVIVEACTAFQKLFNLTAFQTVGVR